MSHKLFGMYSNQYFGVGSGIQSVFEANPGFMAILVLAAIWDLAWRGYGMWHASRNGQRNWFIAMLLVNSIGILPILYIKFWQHKKHSS